MPNLANHLFRQARERGDKVALIYQDERWTFAQIADRVSLVAGGLAAQGVVSGTRVALMCASRPDFIFVQQAVYSLGGTLIPLNTLYRRSDLHHALNCCGVEVLVIDSAFVEHLPDRDKLPELRTVLVFDGDGHDGSADQLVDSGKEVVMHL